jgi:2-oxoglutarate dehydrogenase E1 component
MHRDFRKPLILMTPKSLLRHPMCISDEEDFTDGSYFHRVLWDDAQKGHSELKLKPDAKIKHVVLCSGKVYYDLLAERDARGQDDTYLLRVEQLYPVPGKSLRTELSRFKNAEWVWCQEEPKNQGAWFHMEPELELILTEIGAKNKRARYAGRVASASPATGLASRHKYEQETLVKEALG